MTPEQMDEVLVRHFCNGLTPYPIGKMLAVCEGQIWAPNFFLSDAQREIIASFALATGLVIRDDETVSDYKYTAKGAELSNDYAALMYL